MMQTNVVAPDISAILKAARGVAKNRKQLSAIGRWVASSQTEAVEESFEHDMIRARLQMRIPGLVRRGQWDQQIGVAAMNP